MPRSKVRPRPRSKSSVLRIKKRKTDQAESVWEHLRNLVIRQLYDDVILMYEVTNLCDRDGNIILPTNFEDMETFFEIGRAFFLTDRFAQCDHIYQTLLNSFPMPKFPDEQTAESDFCEDTVRNAHHECLMRMKRYYDAYACLTTIERPEPPIKQKAAYMNVIKASKTKARRTNTSHWIPTKFQEQGLKCQSSIGSAMQFVRFSRCEIPEDFCDKFAQKFTGEDDRRNIEMWLKAHEAAGKCDYVAAIAFLKRMTHCNSRVQTEMAKLYYKAGRKDESRRLLQNVHEKNKRWVDSMDLLAFLLYDDEKKYGIQLSSLATSLLEYWPERPETYTASAYMAMHFDWETAVDYSSRALNTSEPGSDQHSHALILKSRCSMKMNRSVDVERFLREGVSRDRNNIDMCRGLVDLLMSHDEPREAKNMVTSLLHNNPLDVNAKVLKAHALINATGRSRETHNTNIDIIRMMEDILHQHPLAIGEVLDLLNEYYRSNQNETCGTLVELIKQNRLRVPPEQLGLYHQLLSEFNLRRHQPTKSYEHALIATSLGKWVPTSHIIRIEQEYRKSGQGLLEEQYVTICGSSSSTMAMGAEYGVDPLNFPLAFTWSPPASSPSSATPQRYYRSAEESFELAKQAFEEELAAQAASSSQATSSSYNLRSRPSITGRRTPASNLTLQSIDDDLDLSYPMTQVGIAQLDRDRQIFSTHLTETQSDGDDDDDDDEDTSDDDSDAEDEEAEEAEVDAEPEPVADGILEPVGTLPTRPRIVEEENPYHIPIIHDAENVNTENLDDDDM